MAIYLESDFYSNFTGALKSKDIPQTEDLIIDQIGDLVLHEPDSLIQILNQTGVNVKSSASDEKIVDALMRNLSDNDKLKKFLAVLIAKQNGLLPNVDKYYEPKKNYSGANTDEGGTGSGTSKSGTPEKKFKLDADSLAAILNGITTVGEAAKPFVGRNQKPPQTDRINRNVRAKDPVRVIRDERDQMRNRNSGKGDGWSTGVIILVSFLGMVVLGGIGYGIHRSIKAGKAPAA